jgi:hemerythrin-like metal-binding protein
MNQVLIKWSDSYSVGIAEIDNQHIHLIELINQFYNAFLEGRAATFIDTVYNEMINYTDYHFTTEENYLKKHNYPEIKEHTALHQSFIEKINVMLEEYKSGSLTISYDLMNFLRDWLLNHIKGTDMLYAQYFKEQNIIELG